MRLVAIVINTDKFAGDETTEKQLITNTPSGSASAFALGRGLFVLGRGLFLTTEAELGVEFLNRIGAMNGWYSPSQQHNAPLAKVKPFAWSASFRRFSFQALKRIDR